MEKYIRVQKSKKRRKFIGIICILVTIFIIHVLYSHPNVCDSVMFPNDIPKNVPRMTDIKQYVLENPVCDISFGIIYPLATLEDVFRFIAMHSLYTGTIECYDEIQKKIYIPNHSFNSILQAHDIFAPVQIVLTSDNSHSIPDELFTEFASNESGYWLWLGNDTFIIDRNAILALNAEMKLSDFMYDNRYWILGNHPFDIDDSETLFYNNIPSINSLYKLDILSEIISDTGMKANIKYRGFKATFTSYSCYIIYQYNSVVLGSIPDVFLGSDLSDIGIIHIQDTHLSQNSGYSTIFDRINKMN